MWFLCKVSRVGPITDPSLAHTVGIYWFFIDGRNDSSQRGVSVRRSKRKVQERDNRKGLFVLWSGEKPHTSSAYFVFLQKKIKIDKTSLIRQQVSRCLCFAVAEKKTAVRKKRSEKLIWMKCDSWNQTFEADKSMHRTKFCNVNAIEYLMK